MPPPTVPAAGRAAAAGEAARVRRRRRRRSCRSSCCCRRFRADSRPSSSSAAAAHRLHLALERRERRLAAEHDAEATCSFNSRRPQIDAAGWQNVRLDGGQWTLAKVDGDQVVVLREEVFGTDEATPVAGDFNGDGVSDIGVFIDGQWFLDLNGNGGWDEGDLWAKLGTRDDLPVTGDWDADGKTDIGIYGPAWPRDPWAISREPGLPDAGQLPDDAGRQDEEHAAEAGRRHERRPRC